MKRKNYIQPATEVVMMHMANLMLTVSTNPGGGGGGSAHAPHRGTGIPD